MKSNLKLRFFSLFLTFSLCLTILPVQALATTAPIHSAPAQSAPFEQPEPVDYEQENSAASSAQSDSNTLLPSNSTTDLSVSEASSTSADPSIPSEESYSFDEESETTISQSDDKESSSSLSATEESSPSQEQVLRQPIVRKTYDPYEQQYGEPVKMSEYTRVFSVRSTPVREEYTTVVSPIPNSYTDENGVLQAIDNTLVVADSAGIPTYENAANDKSIALPVNFATGDG